MGKLLLHEVDELKKKLLGLCAMVEERVQKAVISVERKDAAMAREIIDSDVAIDAVEISVEEECLKILALHQPVAVDLRFIISALKLNSDLERIGDLAVNIAERALELAGRPSLEGVSNLSLMADKSRIMLKKCLDALINLDEKLGAEVCKSDDEVDALYREMYIRVKDGIAAHPDRIDDYLNLLSISRHLERIADHTTNIAEDVIYLVEGEIIRHRGEAFKA